MKSRVFQHLGGNPLKSTYASKHKKANEKRESVSQPPCDSANKVLVINLHTGKCRREDKKRESKTPDCREVKLMPIEDILNQTHPENGPRPLFEEEK